MATTAASLGVEATAIRSQLLDKRQGLIHMGGQGLHNHFQTAAAGDGEHVDLYTRIHGLAQGRTSISKVTLWYSAPGRLGPAGQGASDQQGEVCKEDSQLRLRKVTAREEMPQRNLPFLQGTNLPRNTTARKTALPKPLPVGISLLLVNSSLMQALRKTQPAARRPSLKQITELCYAQRRVRQAAPQKTPQPASRRIPFMLNQERDVAS